MRGAASAGARAYVCAGSGIVIVAANLQSSHLDELVRAVCVSLKSSLCREVRFEAGATLDDFRSGRVGLALLCGLAYSLLHDAAPDRFAPIAAPVPDDDRGRDTPVYFSDVVVPLRSDAADLHDIRGARFAYNDDISFSGYRALEHELRESDLTWNLFSERVRTGSHSESLARIADGTADAAAIDSHVLCLEKRRNPGLARQIRTIASLGPYPAPLVAVNFDAPVGEINALLDALPDDLLRAAAVRRWQPVDDAYYDTIRKATAGLPGLVA